MRRNLHLAVLLSLLALPVGAYVHSLNTNGNLLRRTAEDAANVQFFMNDNMLAGATNGDGTTIMTADSDPLAALQQAAGHWDNPPDSFLRTSVLGLTGDPVDSEDGINVISFADTPELRAAVGGALAIARRSAFADGIIVDSDIVFTDVGTFGEDDIPFSTNVAPDTFHFTSVASHEIGHTHGLGHSGVAGATMFARTAEGTDLQERPKGDDITFARDIYGNPDVSTLFGSIQGTISLSGGGPAGGVYVAVVDPSTGFVVATLTDSAGAYDTGPIPPGNYLVSAEPVDGPAETFDYPRRNQSSFNMNVKDGFFGGHGSPQAPQAVTVTAGKNVANANFSLDAGPKTLDLRLIGMSPVGSPSFSAFGGGPQELLPGESKDIVLFGPGIDDAAITNANIRILGDAVTLRPGSVMVDTRFTINAPGYSGNLLRMTVDAAASVQGVPLASIAIFKGGDVTVYTGAIVVKGEAVSEPQNPEFTSEGLTHSARLDAGDVAPEEIVALFGLYLADFEQVASLPLGASLGGVSVEVTDSQGVTRPCLMFGAFPENQVRAFSQLNFMIAAGTATGPGTLTVRRASGGVHSIGINVVAVAPGVFTANASGSGFPAANILRFIDGVQDPPPPALPPVVSSAAIDLGPPNHQVYLSLFLTGVRNAPPGSVQVRIGGMTMNTVFGPAMSPEFAGLDQLNVLLDRMLIGKGLVDVEIIVNGVVANIVQINIQ